MFSESMDCQHFVCMVALFKVMKFSLIIIGLHMFRSTVISKLVGTFLISQIISSYVRPSPVHGSCILRLAFDRASELASARHSCVAVERGASKQKTWKPDYKTVFELHIGSQIVYDIASAEREPVMGVWHFAPNGVQGKSPLAHNYCAKRPYTNSRAVMTSFHDLSVSNAGNPLRVKKINFLSVSYSY
jgi:hypothetical protein